MFALCVGLLHKPYLQQFKYCGSHAVWFHVFSVWGRGKVPIWSTAQRLESLPAHALTLCKQPGKRRESSEESRSMIRRHAKKNSRVKGVKGTAMNYQKLFLLLLIILSPRIGRLLNNVKWHSIPHSKNLKVSKDDAFHRFLLFSLWTPCAFTASSAWLSSATLPVLSCGKNSKGEYRTSADKWANSIGQSQKCINMWGERASV